MAAPLRSMTGFARVRGPLGDGEVVVSVKALNHRALDLHIQAASAADPFESAIRALVKGHVARGHVEVRISLPKATSNGNAASALNREFLAEYLRIFCEEAAAHGLDSKPDLNAALRIPGMLADAGEPSAPEGAEIAAEMRAHNAQVAAAARTMEQLREAAAEHFQARLSERLRELLKGVQADPQRLAQEAAILADRSDIEEELARLKIHSAQLAGLLDTGGEAGKKLDFLLQEMNRET